MARLDRLGSAKNIAQIEAAIGREFSHSLLAAVARKPGAEVQSALDRLVQSGLMFRQIATPLDAEEWRGLVGAYLDAACTAVTEWGGKVNDKLGDGLIALFGYPVAQESDLQRAAHAAHAIQCSLVELNRKNDRDGKAAAEIVPKRCRGRALPLTDDGPSLSAADGWSVQRASGADAPAG